MFHWLIGSSLKFRFLVVAAAVTLMVYGMDQLRKIPVDVFPEFAPPVVEIQTEGPGMSAEEVEELITIPLEFMLRGTPGLDVMRSTTVNALSQIRMIFERGEDLMLARQRVQEMLKLAIPHLPTSAGMPIVLQPLSSTSRTLKIGLTSDTLNMMELSMVAYWKMRFHLLRVPGVANVPIWGERIKSLQVQVDPEKLKAYGVRLDGHRFASGETTSGFVVPAGSEGEFMISVDLNLLQTAPELLFIVRDAVHRDIPYVLEGQLGVDIPAVKPVRFETEGMIRLQAATH